MKEMTYLGVIQREPTMNTLNKKLLFPGESRVYKLYNGRVTNSSAWLYNIKNWCISNAAILYKHAQEDAIRIACEQTPESSLHRAYAL